MAEAFRLEVEGWDSETSLHDSASESSAPGDGPLASPYLGGCAIFECSFPAATNQG